MGIRSESMRARSRRLFTCWSSDWALRLMAVRRARSRSLRAVASWMSWSTGPRMRVSGVRSSWLTLAKNLVLKPSISLSFSRATCSSPFLRVSSALRSIFSVMLRPSGSRKATWPLSSRMGVREKSMAMVLLPWRSPNTSKSQRTKRPARASPIMSRTRWRTSSDTDHQRASQKGRPTTSARLRPAPSSAAWLISSTVPSTSSRPRNWYMESRMMRAILWRRTSGASSSPSTTPRTEVCLVTLWRSSRWRAGGAAGPSIRYGFAGKGANFVPDLQKKRSKWICPKGTRWPTISISWRAWVMGGGPAK